MCVCVCVCVCACACVAYVWGSSRLSQVVICRRLSSDSVFWSGLLPVACVCASRHDLMPVTFSFQKFGQCSEQWAETLACCLVDSFVCLCCHVLLT